MSRINGIPSHHPIPYIWGIVLQIAVVLFVGGGALSNMAAGRLKFKPTVAMVITYCLSCILLPLGIWGFIELSQIRNRKLTKRREVAEIGAKSQSSFSPGFLRRAATLSWASGVVGFMIVLFCGASHVRLLIDVAIAIFFFALILSFVLAVVALLGVKEHGKKGILIPALFGICISGFFILLGCLALVVGFVEAEADSRHKHDNAAGSSSLNQTNAGSNSNSH